MSPFFSNLKPMTSVETPSRVVERSSSMPETVLTTSSTGLVIDDSISSTLAPLSVVVIATTGTSTLGNNSTPSRAYDASPNTTGPRTSMVVNTGRRMQMSQIVMSCGFCRVGRVFEAHHSQQNQEGGPRRLG